MSFLVREGLENLELIFGALKGSIGFLNEEGEGEEVREVREVPD